MTFRPLAAAIQERKGARHFIPSFQNNKKHSSSSSSSSSSYVYGTRSKAKKCGSWIPLRGSMETTPFTPLHVGSMLAWG
jgi:hypothetical protein